jgi:hypothetical protein
VPGAVSPEASGPVVGRPTGRGRAPDAGERTRLGRQRGKDGAGGRAQLQPRPPPFRTDGASPGSCPERYRPQRNGAGGAHLGPAGPGSLQTARSCLRIELSRDRSRQAGHLRASHCKPWRDSTNEERLDGENGLLLTPSIDHLFDRGFISFRSDGRLLVSPVAHVSSLERIGVHVSRPINVGAFTERQRHFLEAPE